MKINILLALGLLFVACHNHEHSHNENGESHTHSHHHSNDHSHHGGANKHMHQSSVEDLIERFESPERDEYQQPEKVLDYLGDLQGKTVMDIGAGSGYFSVKLTTRGANVIAADVDDEFQSYLKQRIEKDSIENITLRKLAYDSPGLDTAEVDMVLIVNTYHHIEDRVNYFKKLKAGLKEGGELVVVDFFKKETPVGPPVGHKIAKGQVVEELSEAGFKSFDTNSDLLPYQYIIKSK